MSTLPNKYVPVDHSLIGLTALVIDRLSANDTVSSLWNKLSGDQRIRTFDRFADALALGFAAGLLDLEEGVIILTSERGEA